MSELRTKKLSAEYNSKIFSDISFVLSSGELIALCGRNGCGKSTLLSVIAGVSNTELKISGTVNLDEREIKSFKRRELAQNLAYMEQSEYSTWNFSVYDYVLQGRFAYSKNGYYSEKDFQICQEVISEVKIDNLSERNVHELSGGEFQKVRIARALAQQPKFMLLDEPAASLDFVYEPQLMQMLKDFCAKKQIGIILSMHDVNLAARYADKLLFMAPETPAIFGTPAEVLNEENLMKTYGVEFTKKSTSEMFFPKL